MAKLVAYYSRAGENYFGGNYRYISEGNTEKIAKMIAQITGAELFKIEPKKPYSEDYQTCIEQARKDLRNHARPELVYLPENLDSYDEIYLGYPNYWGDLPMFVYTFLDHYDWNGKTIHPFCTHEGSGLGTTVQKLKKEMPNAIITNGLAIEGGSVDHAKRQVENWV